MSDLNQFKIRSLEEAIRQIDIRLNSGHFSELACNALRRLKARHEQSIENLKRAAANGIKARSL